MTATQNPLRDSYDFMQLRSLPVGAAGVVAATTANIAAGHINIPVTIVYLLAVLCTQVLANLTEIYFRIRNKRFQQQEMERNHYSQTAGGSLQMHVKIVFKSILFITLTLGFALTVVGGYWILIAAAIAMLGMYLNSGYKNPQGTSVIGVIVCFLCFGPLEVVTGVMLNEMHCDNTVLSFDFIEKLLGVGVLAGLMAVNALLVYIYTNADNYSNNDKATLTQRMKRSMLLWFYAIDSIAVVALGITIVMTSNFLEESRWLVFLNAVLFGVYFYIWMNMPKCTGEYKKGKRLQNTSMISMLLYFVLIMIWMFIVDGSHSVVTYFF